jgi:hypothetical protein
MNTLNKILENPLYDGNFLPILLTCPLNRHASSERKSYHEICTVYFCFNFMLKYHCLRLLAPFVDVNRVVHLVENSKARDSLRKYLCNIHEIVHQILMNSSSDDALEI